MESHAKDPAPGAAHRAFDPRRLPLRHWIERGETLEGSKAQAELAEDFPRFEEACCGPMAEPLVWRAVGYLESTPGTSRALRRHWLDLEVRAYPALRCNRCLEIFHGPLESRRRFLVATDEESAEQLDEPQQDDFDVIADASHFNLLALLEDELLLALPIVPMHVHCTLPDAGSTSDAATAQSSLFGTLLARQRPAGGEVHHNQSAKGEESAKNDGNDESAGSAKNDESAKNADPGSREGPG